MEHEVSILITLVAAAGFGLLAQILAHRWRIPAIVLLLALGILLGESALGVVRTHELGNLSILVKLAVAIILFEGALNLNLKILQQCEREVRRLVTVGVLLSWGLTALITHFVAGFEWRMALLFGALMTVTGPTVVQPVLQRISVPRSVKTVLEGEAILVDPIGAILAIAVLDIILASAAPGGTGFLGWLWAYFGRLLIGGVVGILGGLGLGLLMKRTNLVPAELSNLVALSAVWVTFGIAEGLHSEAGIMAAVVMGLVVQRQGIPAMQRLRRFKESLTTLGISMLFILLAAGLDVPALWQEGLTGLLEVALIMFVARPLAVFLSTWGTRLDWRRKAFIAWVGPRGIIAASVASIFALALEESGMPGGERLLALTFLTILLTVTVQGLTAGLLARLLGLQNMEGEKILLVGANGLGCAIGRLIQEYGRSVLFMDTNRTSIERANQKGMNAVYGNALEEDTLEELHAEDFASFLALTPNSEVNVLACQLVQDAFGTERAFPALSNPARGANPALLKQTGGRLAFGRFIDITEWDDREKTIRDVTWQVPSDWQVTHVSRLHFPRELLPVLRLRRGSPELVHGDQSWQAGDTIVFVTPLSLQAAQEALRQLAVA